MIAKNQKFTKKMKNLKTINPKIFTPIAERENGQEKAKESRGYAEELLRTTIIQISTAEELTDLLLTLNPQEELSAKQLHNYLMLMMGNMAINCIKGFEVKRMNFISMKKLNNARMKKSK
jgi:hypothetical protein